MGIPVRKQAKYLGVTYDRTLSIKCTLKAFEPKCKWIQARIYRVLQRSNFRTRYNLWQIFICPLFRMALSVIGESNSERAKKCFEAIRKAMRVTLKRFTLSPRLADSTFFDLISQGDDFNFRFVMERGLKGITSRIG